MVSKRLLVEIKMTVRHFFTDTSPTAASTKGLGWSDVALNLRRSYLSPPSVSRRLLYLILPNAEILESFSGVDYRLCLNDYITHRNLLPHRTGLSLISLKIKVNFNQRMGS